MNILYITAGAAQMYCGSCLTDNALARELISQGHKVTLLPLYTPTRTDEPNVSHSRVFFGGISVFLEQRSSFFRKRRRFLDRLWDSPAVIRAVSSGWIRTDPAMLGELTVSVLRGEDGFQRKEFLKLVEWLSHEESPDVVSLPNTLLIGLARPLKKALNRPVVCMLQGEDFFLQGLREPHRTNALGLIRAGFPFVDLFVAVSRHYAEFMSAYLGIPSAKIRVVPLGINLNNFDPFPRSKPEPFTVGYLARVTPEKGLHVLCEAYRRMRRDLGLPVSKLKAAGYLAPDHRGYVAGIGRKVREWELESEFEYKGELSRQEKVDFLNRLSVFSVPATYDDPKGIYLLEAMASGVPVVQPRRGAYTEIIEKAGGGLLVSADDPGALAQGLISLWKDPGLRDELGKKGINGVRAHYSISLMASRMISVYASLLESGTRSAPAVHLARQT